MSGRPGQIPPHRLMIDPSSSKQQECPCSVLLQPTPTRLLGMKGEVAKAITAASRPLISIWLP
jgi:hypothetical protein